MFLCTTKYIAIPSSLWLFNEGGYQIEQMVGKTQVSLVVGF